MSGDAKSEYSLIITPSVKDLLKLTLERGAIEDGLCNPDNTKMFISASQSFLRLQLQDRLQNPTASDLELSKLLTTSELLLQKTSTKMFQEIIADSLFHKRDSCTVLNFGHSSIKLKNADEHTNLIEKEITKTVSELKLEEILPMPNIETFPYIIPFRRRLRLKRTTIHKSLTSFMNSVSNFLSRSRSYIHLDSTKSNIETSLKSVGTQTATDFTITRKSDSCYNWKQKYNEMMTFQVPTNVCLSDSCMTLTEPNKNRKTKEKSKPLVNKTTKLKRQQSKLSVCNYLSTSSSEEFE